MMRALVRRVLSASVSVDGQTIGEINRGLLVFLAVHKDDDDSDLGWISQKIIGMRVFDDEEQKMNISLVDKKYDLLVISQFTLFGSLRKGFRPSFNHAANQEFAIAKYHKFLQIISEKCMGRVASGEFGSDMKIHSIDDGPVSLWLDSKEKNY
ncbi:MAG: D-aminoacyl-tRNA deacylase [Opitutales bacterium]|nr:D-aminoacyl-tRNA deacylase [Opitutales bacterium]